MVQEIFVVVVEFAAAAGADDQNQPREWVNVASYKDNRRDSTFALLSRILGRKTAIKGN